VVLFEIALGSLALLWVAPLWGVVRPGFFKLVGATVVACALLAFAAGRTELEAAGADGRAAARWLGAFALAVLAWQVLLYANRGSGGLKSEAPTRAAGAQLEPSGSPPVDKGSGGLKSEAPTRAAGAQLEPSGSPPVNKRSVARWAGVAAVLPGLAVVWPLAALSGRPLGGTVALLTGALFLGATTDGLLLGHWYLVDRRLSNRPILALATWLIVGVAAALVSASLGGERGGRIDQSLSPLLAFPNLTVWLAVGLVLVCALLAGFIRVLVRGGSIQAATGMFYLAVVMALAAEFAAKVYFFQA
jgi:hypothetical protein